MSVGGVLLFLPCVQSQKADEIRAMKAMTSSLIQCCLQYCLQLLNYLIQLISTVLAVTNRAGDVEDGGSQENVAS